MLQDMLSDVKEKLMSSSIINEKRIDALVENMEYWKSEADIYPANIRSIINSDYKTVYEVLDRIKDMGILEYRFEIYCNICDRFLERKQLKSLNEFPKGAYCDENHALNPVDNTILIYKVVHYE